MSSDRTTEFLSLARGLPVTTTTQQQAAAPHSNKLPVNNVPAATTQLRDFHSTASEISRDIASTSALLKELTDRVRRKSLLQDDAGSMNSLVIRIKSSMENLNARLDQAGSYIKNKKRQMGKNSQAGQEAANLVDGLKTEFAEAAGSFKQVLQLRTDNMKESDDMQRQVYGNTAAGSAADDNPMPTLSLAPPPVYGQQSQSLLSSAQPGSSSLGAGGPPAANNFMTLDLTSGMMASGESTNSALPRPHGMAGNDYSTTTYTTADDGMRNRLRSPDGTTGNNSLPSYSGSYSSFQQQQQHYQAGVAPVLTPLDIARMEQEQQLQTQLIPDQDYLRERANAMSTVETNIVELGTIFNKLAVMVNEHADMVQRVEDNVDESNTNINLSMGVLTDTFENLRTNRALALRVFGILVAFIVMFIIFFA